MTKVGDYKKIIFCDDRRVPIHSPEGGRTLNRGKCMLEKILHTSQIVFQAIYESKYETVYLVNNETFVYVGMVTLNCDIKHYDYSIAQRNPDGSFPEELGALENVEFKELVICELNYDSYKGITPASFNDINRDRLGKKKSPISLGILIHNYPFYSYGDQLHDACVEHCCELLKGRFDIHKILNEFKGVPCAVVLYKIVENGKNGYAALWTDKMDRAHEFAKEGYKKYIPYCLDFEIRWPYCGQPLRFKASDNFKKIYKEWAVRDGIGIKDKKDINQYIIYRINKTLDDTFKIDGRRGQGYLLLEKIIEEAERGDYDEQDFYSFTDGRTKWKNEFLVYQIVKTLYPRETVYQYSPTFLRTKKGQLSYDVFISGLNIAIEHQGEQHFKQIDFFGGEEDFKARKKRDVLKRKLSAENGIKLIYIYYNEDISEELVVRKISEVI